MTRPRALYPPAVGAAVEEPRDGAASAADGLPRLLGRGLVDLAVGGDHDAVRGAGLRGGDLAVERVGEHELGIAIERVAEPGAACDVLPELVARVEHDHPLRGQLLAGTVRAHDEGVRGDTGRAPLEPPRRRREALAAM